ncbi:hypothetical protein QMO56_24960 [Roseomonas sp. E05]|uniref:hypothetical protein n=1 Tax=Roseomonas sp. E05 TaxID=3046310 RepID=UPI0024B9BDD9|nr:hypothetical protein [Roseomonas sp. E05]MDJ0391362.1 hypothetical protein [Roseomonas sp. E05]
MKRRRKPTPPPARPAAPIRLLILEACRDAEGQPRAALALPGLRLPVVYPSLAAAVAAKTALEAPR